MTKELELLSKMDLTEENRAKLQALLEEQHIADVKEIIGAVKPW